MPRPIWNGSISFGLVNVPVKVFTATSPQDVRFHQLRRTDASRIRQKRVSALDGEEVPYEEIVKGYELGPDQYVIIEPDELAALDPKKTQTIDIEEFVSLDQIDPIFYEHAYYLVPDKRAEKAYALLAAAMAASGKVAIARFVMRTKQYLAAVRPAGRVLVLSTMLYADEVVPVDRLEGLPDPAEADLSERELQMAEALIESLSAETFEPEKFHDTYRSRVLELIEAKAAGETLVAAPAEDTGARVVDLMAALEASVKAAKERRAAGGDVDEAPAGAAKTARTPTKAAAKTTARAATKTAAKKAVGAPTPPADATAAEEDSKQVRTRRRKSA
jgi:DNA end-binding protein Ku